MNGVYRDTTEGGSIINSCGMLCLTPAVSGGRRKPRAQPHPHGSTTRIGSGQPLHRAVS